MTADCRRPSGERGMSISRVPSAICSCPCSRALRRATFPSLSPWRTMPSQVGHVSDEEGEVIVKTNRERAGGRLSRPGPRHERATGIGSVICRLRGGVWKKIARGGASGSSEADGEEARMGFVGKTEVEESFGGVVGEGLEGLLIEEDGEGRFGGGEEDDGGSIADSLDNPRG
jgi:hypothetical protein